MEFRLSRHAEWELGRRGLTLAMVRAVLESTEQQLLDESGAGSWFYPSRVRLTDGKMYLLRVVVAEEHTPPVVVTVYRTSKLAKYSRDE